jgi:hypothetical protein
MLRSLLFVLAILCFHNSFALKEINIEKIDKIYNRDKISYTQLFNNKYNYSFGIVAGIPGTGIEGKFKINDNLYFRTGFNWFNINSTENKAILTSGIEAKLVTDFKLYVVPMMLDYYPLYNGFKISAGLSYSMASIDSRLTTAKNDELYNLEKISGLSPSISIGYDYTLSDNAYFAFDCGILYNPKSKVKMLYPNNDPDQTRYLEDETNKALQDVIPIFKVGFFLNF